MPHKTYADPIGSIFHQIHLDTAGGSTVHGVLTLDGNPGTQAVVQQLEAMVQRNHHLKQSLVKNGKGFVWKDVPDFQTEQQVHVLTLAGLDPDQEVNGIISESLSHIFSPDCPLWEARVITFEKKPDRCDIYFRVGHALGDGFSLMKLLCNSVGAQEVLEDWAACRRSPSPSEELQKKSWSSSFLSTVGNCVRSIGRVLHFALIYGGDQRFGLRAEESSSPSRRVFASATVDLDDVRALRVTPSGLATVNDVFVAAIGLAVDRYFTASSEKPLPQSITALSMHNIRNPVSPKDWESDSDSSLQITYVPTPVLIRPKATVTSPTGPAPAPLSDSDEAAAASGSLRHRHDEMASRVAATSEAHSAIKASPEPLIVFKLYYLLARLLPIPLVTNLGRHLTGKCTLFYSNIRGPNRPIRFAGHAVTSLRVCSHPAHGSAVLSLVSYCGKVHINLIADVERIKRPELFLSILSEILSTRSARPNPQRPQPGTGAFSSGESRIWALRRP